MKRNDEAWWVIAGAAVSIPAIFTIDMLLPIGWAGGTLYVVVILFGWWFTNPRYIFMLAGTVTGLILMGFLLSRDAGQQWPLWLFNTLVSIFAVWVASALLFMAKRREFDLKSAYDGLEGMVEERTRELQTEIAERKRSEEDRAESERRLSTLMSNLPGMAYRCLEGDFKTTEFVSEGVRELLGYAPEEVIGTNILEYIERHMHPDDKGAAPARIEAALEARQPWQAEYRMRTKDGEWKWIWERSIGVFSEEGTLIAKEGFLTDITARKDAERLHLVKS